MTHKTNSYSLIANALIWASLMISTALILGGSGIAPEKQFFLITLQIAGWYSVSSLLLRHGRSFKSEWACIHSHMSKRKW